MTTQTKIQSKNIKPSKKELLFLNLAYNRFYDLYEKLEKAHNSLTEKSKFELLKNIFQIYSECLKYEPIKYYLKVLKENRPPGDIISLNYFEIIRHVLVHFPFFDTWNEVYFSKDLILWNGRHSKINNFFVNNVGEDEYKWRIWNNKKKKMTYGYILKFPKKYSKDYKIYLKDLIDENQGIEISLLMIKQVLESQIESIRK